LKTHSSAPKLKDNFKLGIVLGLLAPLLGILGFYFWKAYPVDFWYYMRALGQEQRLLTNAVTFSLFANAIVFTIFINSRRDKTAKGVFIVTVLYAIAAIVLKLAV
jgi:hypothetical protein